MTDELEKGPATPENPEAGPKDSASKSGKVAIGAILAIVLVAGLYLVNRYWIAPATKKATSKTGAAANRPVAPLFSATDINGRKFDLADHKGKVILLNFWATWCGPCRIEIPGFVKMQERYRDQGFLIVGVSEDDSVEPVREFYREFNMNYPVAMGENRVSQLYGGIVGLPTTFVIGRDGRIYSKHMGAADMSVFEAEVKELLAAEGAQEVAEFTPVGRAETGDQIKLGNPAEIDSEVPGVDLTGVDPKQVAAFKKKLEGMSCDCGCKMNVLECRHKDPACGLSKGIAKQEFAKLAGATEGTQAKSL